MKNLVLIKQHSSFQLAHLYEHIICMHVKQLFYANGLYKYIDYSIAGTTFHEGGTIEIDVRAYTPKAISLLPAITNLPVNFDKGTISTTFTQLLAEEEKPLSSTGFLNVQQTLRNLHAQPWTSLDDNSIIDTKGFRRKATPVFVSEGDPLPARKLTATVFLDNDFSKSHRNLLPLFHQLAKVYTLTGRDLLSCGNGYYNDDMIFKNTSVKTCMQAILKVADANDIFVNIKQDLRGYQNAFISMRSNGAFERLLKQLRDVSYYHAAHFAPDDEEILQDTAILIGSKGWQEIATMENIELLLKHMSIEIKFGRKKVSAPLVKD